MPGYDKNAHGRQNDRDGAITHIAEPIGRMGRPEEVAETVLWLCGPGASFITGQSIPVDGGYTIQ